ncbi:MAG: DNA-binding protein [Bacteroidota bacterium]|nr:DNA-binding protein [Bacteroidota bacterium]
MIFCRMLLITYTLFLTPLKETENLKSQFATSSLVHDKVWGGRRNLPYAFTEQGVAMLSSVLNSKTAIEVNIRIIRVFTKIREVLINNKDILLKVERLERNLMKQNSKVNKHEKEMQVVFAALRELLNPIPKPRKTIGFKANGT